LAVPVLLSLQIRPSSFVLGHGAKVSYTDSRAGATTFTVQRRVRRRWVTVGTFTHRGRAGRNFVRFGRRFGKFGRGAYRLEATPRTVGAIGVTRRVRFTIIK
jgi:hypothetical protein